MTDSTPLIPEKSGTACGDVRRALHPVLRSLPPLPPKGTAFTEKIPSISITASAISASISRALEFNSPSGGENRTRDRRARGDDIPWRGTGLCGCSPGLRGDCDCALLRRVDTMPTVEQGAAGDALTWLQRERDSEELPVIGTRVKQPMELLPPPDYCSLQSLSIGRTVELKSSTLSASVAEQLPVCVVCSPKDIHFINFTVGQQYSSTLRLVNVSRYTKRLSISPPQVHELSISLGARGLTVTAGASNEFDVSFVPRHPRPVRELLRIRVEGGRDVEVPVLCYMEPPLLHVVVMGSPNLSPLPAASPRSNAAVLDLGAALLGETHRASTELRCLASHAEFCVLSEEYWIQGRAVVSDACRAGSFSIWPARWTGGGPVPGGAACRAGVPGLHTAALRLLSATGITRSLQLIADSLSHRPEHVTLHAAPRDYDICGVADAGCAHYLHLGCGPPGRRLSGAVLLINHSPVAYKYSWSVRPWGSCTCHAESDEEPCPGAEASVNSAGVQHISINSAGVQDMSALQLSELNGELMPRSEKAVQVWVEADEMPGVHRAVLVLTLHDIPKESFPSDATPKVCSETVINEEPVPGFKGVERVAWSIVHAQLELCWRVQLPQISLMPIHLDLRHSRRIKSQLVTARGWLLAGSQVNVSWSVPPGVEPPTSSCLTEDAVLASILLPLPPLDVLTTDVITLTTEATPGQHLCPSTSASAHVTRWSEPRALSLSPARVWLGVRYPGQVVETDLVLKNDTHEQVYFCTDRHRWLGGSDPACEHACAACHTRACTCDVLRPARGHLPVGGQCGLHFKLMLPKEDGACIWLVSARRTYGDVRHGAGAAGSHARATVLAARVLAPRVIVIPVEEDPTGVSHGKTCAEQRGEARREAGAAGALLRLRLYRGGADARALQLVNTTPLHTDVQWEPPLGNNSQWRSFTTSTDSEEPVRIIFKPNKVHIGGHSRLNIEVCIEALAVCSRRVLLRRALVRHGEPLILLFDVAIEGVRVCLELPAGKDRVPIRRTERVKVETCECLHECCCRFSDEPQDPAVVFAKEDELRMRNKEWKCSCHKVWRFIPKASPYGSIYHGIEIVTEPPPKTKVCPCGASCQPLPSPPTVDPPAITFTHVPANTESSQLLWLHNPGSITAKWRVYLRKHTRPADHLRRRLLRDVGDIDSESESGPGLQIWCEPAEGTLLPGDRVVLKVSLLARRPGLFRDQLLLQVARVAPIVLDLWAEILGTLLQLLTFPTSSGEDQPYILWLSTTDPERTLRAKNVSGTTLNIQAYIFREHDSPEDKLPFRLMYRFLDVQPVIYTCACTDSKENSRSSLQLTTESESIQMDTGFELFLAPDVGYAEEKYFQVNPFISVVQPGGMGEWCVRSVRETEPPPPARLLLRIQPELKRNAWWRPPGGTVVVDLRVTSREPRLQAPRCVRMRLCGLDLPKGDVMRVRKSIIISNVGNGSMTVTLRTAAPWSLVRYGDVTTPDYVTRAEAATARQRHECGAGCRCRGDPTRVAEATLVLPATSSTRIFIEVQVSERDCPSPPAPAPSPPAPLPELPARLCHPVRARAMQDVLFVVRGILEFVENEAVLQTTTLSLSLFIPLVLVEPAIVDFGFVMDGDTRKSYFTVWHTSTTETVDVMASWSGSNDFEISPWFLRLPPGARAHVYILYTAKWIGCKGPADGTLTLTPRGGAQRPVTAVARATAARDSKCHRPCHDYTDSDVPPTYER